MESYNNECFCALCMLPGRLNVIFAILKYGFLCAIRMFLCNMDDAVQYECLFTCSAI